MKDRGSISSKVFGAGGTAVIALAMAMAWATASQGQGKIFEVDITKDLWASSGEPQIAVDPSNPKNIAIVEFRRGTKEVPVYSMGNTPEDRARVAAMPYGSSDGDVSLTSDGGNTWRKLPQPSPVNRPPVTGGDPPRLGGGDPYIAYGPGGALYMGQEGSAVREREGSPYNLPDVEVALSYSKDHGRTWTVPQMAGSPADRPWLTVDFHSGTVYTVSSGTLDPATGAHNLRGPTFIADRWLVAWRPGLTAKSSPRRLGGADFSASAGNTITAAHGVLAATFVINGGGPPGPGGAAASQPIPSSLKFLVTDGTTECTNSKPCLFFQTSRDEALHWTRKHVPVPMNFSGQRVSVAADPGQGRRYAVGFLSQDRTQIMVMTTSDAGSTWEGPFTIPEAAQGVNFKQWMAYSPNGVLGFVWKKERRDLPMSGEPGAQPAFDVYVSVACDGGRSWTTPMRVNAVTSPSGVSRTDDLSYIAMDPANAHMVWGDRRIYPQVKNVPGGSGGTHTFYGRAPFSLLNKGAKCGR